MATSPKSNLRFFVILTYLVFWVLFGLTGLSVALKAPEIVQTVMKNVCAWSSTFVILIWFKKFYPGKTLKGFLAQQFPKTSFANFAIPTLIQLFIMALATIGYYAITGKSLENITFISTAAILPTTLIFITSGPMGEELGWRGYALNELQTKRSPLTAALIVGLVWGLWHFPLWIITGLTGIDLIIYCMSFMLGIISFSVFMTYFYNQKKNLAVAIWMHFLFNFLLQVVVIEDFIFLLYISVGYLIASVCIVLLKRKEMTVSKDQTISGFEVKAN